MASMPTRAYPSRAKSSRPPVMIASCLAGRSRPVAPLRPAGRPGVTDFDYTGIDVTDPTVTGVFAPDGRHVDDLATLLDEVTVWSRALAPVRARTTTES